MQPVAQRDRARHRPRRQALRDNRRLLRRAPASPPRRSRQNLDPPETVPINWQITWQTSLPASPEQGRIIRSPSAPARWGQRFAYDVAQAPAAELAALLRRALGDRERPRRTEDAAARGAGRAAQQTPELVRQEFWGLLLAHFAVRGLMHEAALKADEDPDYLSFSHAVRVIRRKLPLFAALSPSGQGHPA